MTCLEKTGRFENLGLVRVPNKKRGLQVVMMYLIAGPLRLPWAFRVWRGKGSESASEFAVKLLRTLPPALLRRFRVLLLADGGFGNIVFLEGAWVLPAGGCLDWGEVAERVRMVLVPDLVLEELLAQLQRLRPYLEVTEVMVGT